MAWLKALDGSRLNSDKVWKVDVYQYQTAAPWRVRVYPDPATASYTALVGDFATAEECEAHMEALFVGGA
jgi:hypothetical protein